MKIDRQKTFYYLGNAFIIFNVILLTALLFISDCVPGVVVSFYKLKNVTAVCYLMALVLYCLSPKYFKRQVCVVVLGCIIFVLFWFVFIYNL